MVDVVPDLGGPEAISDAEIRELLDRLGVSRGSNLISVLQSVQDTLGYLPRPVLEQISKRTGIRLSNIYGVVSFYSRFRAAAPARNLISICSSVSCLLGESESIRNALRDELGIERGVTPDGLFCVETVSCLGACAHGPVALINDQLFTRLTPSRLRLIVDNLRAGECAGDTSVESPLSVSVRIGKLVGGILLSTDRTESLDEYRARGGYAALADALRRSPTELIEKVKQSGLRGKGGAGFPCGLKWASCAGSPGDTKYVVCNADEGEPGNFKDRWILEMRPHLILEGLALACYAVGARLGYVYIRGEYRDAIEIIRAAVREARSAGILGSDVLGSGRPLDLDVFSGAGAYVCGEETALVESMEGKRGTARLRPPYPTQSGLYGCPTVVNNVETLASVSLIALNGASAYASDGTAQSPGTKLFSVSGDVADPGLLEAAYGLTVQEVLDWAGGGKDGRQVKAALIGGPAGRLVPAQQFERSLSYEDIPPGAGAVVAIGEQRSIRKIAANIMGFFAHESCGFCAPCRIGTKRLEEMLNGDAPFDAESARRITQVLRATSRCGLGQAAANALDDALLYFGGEFGL